MAKKRTIEVQGIEVRVEDHGLGEYTCITDIARTVELRTNTVIQNWLRNKSTIDFLGFWEIEHNADFKDMEFDVIRKRAGDNAFVLTQGEWIGKTEAVGIVSKVGRYGGTFAHFDIASHFCNWLSAQFYVKFIKEFRRMREENLLESKWDLRRELAKGNYLIHTESVRHNLVPVMEQRTKQEGYKMSSEADLLNEVLFGMKAGEWRKINPSKKGNIRDHATTEELHVLANLEALNAEFLEMGFKQDERRWRLEAAKTRHLSILEGRDLLG